MPSRSQPSGLRGSRDATSAPTTDQASSSTDVVSTAAAPEMAPCRVSTVIIARTGVATAVAVQRARIATGMGRWP